VLIANAWSSNKAEGSTPALFEVGAGET
jgi:hypothetical protein